MRVKEGPSKKGSCPCCSLVEGREDTPAEGQERAAGCLGKEAHRGRFVPVGPGTTQGFVSRGFGHTAEPPAWKYTICLPLPLPSQPFLQPRVGPDPRTAGHPRPTSLSQAAAERAPVSPARRQGRPGAQADVGPGVLGAPQAERGPAPRPHLAPFRGRRVQSGAADVSTAPAAPDAGP